MLRENILLSLMKKIFLPLLFIGTMLYSQDFGYEYLMLTEYRSIGGSYNVQKFNAQSTNPLSDSNRTTFSTALPCIEFRQHNGRLAVGYQTFTDINGKSKESFSVYAESQNDFPIGIQKQHKGSFFIPIVVSANYLRAASPSPSVKDFDIGSFGIGTGAKFKHFERSFGIQAFAVGSIFYATEGFSTEYGSQTSISAEVQFVFSEVLYQGLLIGYRFESQQWNMNDNSLDYRRQYHGVFIGFIF